MKKIILTIAAAVFAFPVAALETKENALVCISQKKLTRYENLMKQDAVEFMKIMRNKAECMPMQSSLNIVIETVVGDYVKVETSEGLMVWLNRKDIKE